MRALLIATTLAALAGAQTDTNPQQLFQAAVQAQQKGDDTTAIRDYRQLLRSYPKTVELHANLGAVLAHSGDYPHAITEYREALQLAPSDKTIQLNLALAYFKQQDWKDAAAELNHLHSEQPDDMRSALLLADSDLHLNDPKAAIAVLKPIEDVHPDSIDLERLMTDALLRTGQSREALKRLHALAAATNDASLYTLAAKTALDTNQFELVKKDADAALAIDPNAPGAWTLEGKALVYLLDNDHAMVALQRAIEQNPNDFEAQLAMGGLRSTLRDLPGATEHLKKALELNPSSPVAHYEYGKVENEDGHPEAALTDFLKATQSDPNWLPPHVSLAALYAKLHRIDEARKERELVDKLRAVEQKDEVQRVSQPAP